MSSGGEEIIFGDMKKRLFCRYTFDRLSKATALEEEDKGKVFSPSAFLNRENIKIIEK